ncbi:hypothetical protein [Desulfosporosinus fructosivorans]|uniref:hypothetical protein n=1 Tax=Desulfosporosinus fructosivorans TaxID=2018669 RepID=UPI00308454C7
MSALGSETLSTKELLERLGLKHRPTFSSKQQYRAVKRNSQVMSIILIRNMKE